MCATQVLLMRTCVTSLTLLALAGAGTAHADDATVRISLAAYSSDPASVGFTSSASGIRIDAIWVSMTDIRFQPTSACDAPSVPLVTSGPITADLTQRPTSDVSAVLPSGRFCALDLSWRQSSGRTQGAPGVLRGASVVVQGRRPDGLRFVLRTRLRSSPRLRALELRGFSLTGATHLILAADIAHWMSGLDLSTAETSGTDTRWEVRIDETTNSELLERFQQNLDGGLSLFGDANADRILDEAERAHPLATGS